MPLPLVVGFVFLTLLTGLVTVRNTTIAGLKLDDGGDVVAKKGIVSCTELVVGGIDVGPLDGTADSVMCLGKRKRVGYNDAVTVRPGGRLACSSVKVGDFEWGEQPRKDGYLKVANWRVVGGVDEEEEDKEGGVKLLAGGGPGEVAAFGNAKGIQGATQWILPQDGMSDGVLLKNGTVLRGLRFTLRRRMNKDQKGLVVVGDKTVVVAQSLVSGRLLAVGRVGQDLAMVDSFDGPLAGAGEPNQLLFHADTVYWRNQGGKVDGNYVTLEQGRVLGLAPPPAPGEKVASTDTFLECVRPGALVWFDSDKRLDVAPISLEGHGLLTFAEGGVMRGGRHVPNVRWEEEEDPGSGGLVSFGARRGTLKRHPFSASNAIEDANIVVSSDAKSLVWEKRKRLPEWNGDSVLALLNSRDNEPASALEWDGRELRADQILLGKEVAIDLSVCGLPSTAQQYYALGIQKYFNDRNFVRNVAPFPFAEVRNAGQPFDCIRLQDSADERVLGSTRCAFDSAALLFPLEPYYYDDAVQHGNSVPLMLDRQWKRFAFWPGHIDPSATFVSLTCTLAYIHSPPDNFSDTLFSVRIASDEEHSSEQVGSVSDGTTVSVHWLGARLKGPFRVEARLTCSDLDRPQNVVVTYEIKTRV